MTQNSGGESAPKIFDRALLRQRRDRAAKGMRGEGAQDSWADYNFLVRTGAADLVDRLADTTRQYPRALDLGCHGGELAQALAAADTNHGIEHLVQADISPVMAHMAQQAAADTAPFTISTLAADEEWLPFAPASFDLVISNLSLHWVNDLPGVFSQICRILKPDGLFLANLLGGETLSQLRQSLGEAEMAVEGGLSPRVSPMVDVRDAGNLLRRAGFALPVADFDNLNVSYSSPLKLLSDLRGMGESNVVVARRKTPLRRETLMHAMAHYSENFMQEDSRVAATFQMITLTGWAPDAANQPQPAKRGSATANLVDFISPPAKP